MPYFIILYSDTKKIAFKIACKEWDSELTVVMLKNAYSEPVLILVPDIFYSSVITDYNNDLEALQDSHILLNYHKKSITFSLTLVLGIYCCLLPT